MTAKFLQGNAARLRGRPLSLSAAIARSLMSLGCAVISFSAWASAGMPLASPFFAVIGHRLSSDIDNAPLVHKRQYNPLQLRRFLLKSAGGRTENPVMTIFDELRADYVKWREASAKYEEECSDFARRFCLDFKTYLGAPDQYLELDKQPKWYVQPLSVTKDEGGEYHFEDAASPVDMIERDDEGLWMTGCKLTIDQAPANFPKGYFAFLIRFVIRGENCELLAGFNNKKFEFSKNDAQGKVRIYEYFVDLIRGVLALDPWDFPTKQSIGFVPAKG